MESKIAATERLRREGRWEAASWHRDQWRKKLRAEGMTRREAVEKSWELMVEEYFPLTDDQIDWDEAVRCFTRAAFPIDCAGADHDSEPDMKVIWWPYCYLGAWHSRLKKDDAEGAEDVLLRMWLDAPNPVVETMCLLAIASPDRFLAQVASKFEAAIERFKHDDSVNEYVTLELQSSIHGIREMRRDFRARADAEALANPTEACDACASS